MTCLSYFFSSIFERNAVESRQSNLDNSTKPESRSNNVKSCALFLNPIPLSLFLRTLYFLSIH